MDDKGKEGEGVSREKWRGNLSVINNRKVDGRPFSTIIISDGELCESAESGDVLTIWARSRSTRWVDMMGYVRMKVYVQRIVES